VKKVVRVPKVKKHKYEKTHFLFLFDAAISIRFRSNQCEWWYLFKHRLDSG
jgi:hypothetical protein